MTTDHTPRPWEARDAGDGTWSVYMPFPEFGGQMLCIVNGKTEQTARLIAAAPDLLAADRNALEMLEMLRADLVETDAELHAQRIGVIDLTIAELRAALSRVPANDIFSRMLLTGKLKAAQRAIIQKDQ